MPVIAMRAVGAGGIPVRFVAESKVCVGRDSIPERAGLLNCDGFAGDGLSSSEDVELEKNESCNEQDEEWGVG